MAVRHNRTQISRNLSLSAVQRSKYISREIKTRARRLGQSALVFSAFLLVLIGFVSIFSQDALAQSYPRCITGCTAKDVTLENVYVVEAGTGIPGEPINASIWATLNFNRVNSYCVRIVADVYINGVLEYQDMVSQPYVFTQKGVYDLLLGEISWPYGSVLELRNIQIFWSVDNTLYDPDFCVGCVDYGPGSKCVGYASFAVTQPLVANFEADPLSGCAPLIVQFTDLSSGGYSTDPYSYVWDFGDGSAGSTLENPVHTYDLPGTYTVTLTVTDTLAETDSETKTEYIVVVDCNTDLRITKSASTATATVGELLVYTITVWNDGPGDATGVYVEEAIPTGTIYSTSSASQGSYDEILGVWSVGDLFAGVSASLSLTVQVLPEADVSVENTACVYGNEIDPDPSNNCASTTTTITHAPVLVLQKAPSLGAAFVGDLIDYTITVQHDASSDGSPVTVTQVTDSLGIVLSGPSGDDGDGLLEEGEVWIYAGSREVLPEDPSLLTNEACIEGVDLDGDSVSACGSTTTTIEHAPALLVEKLGSPASALVGETITYTITVQHHNSSDGSPITIDTVDDSLGIPLVGPSGDDGDGILQSAEVWTYVGERTVLPEDPRDLVNTVCVNGTDLDGELVGDCDSTSTTVDHLPELLVEKTALQPTAQVGDTVSYSVTVQHGPSSDGSPVDITDVTDSLGIELVGPSGDNGDGLLQSSETWTFLGSKVIQLDDPTALINEACVAGQDLDGDPIADCDTATVTVEHLPVLQIQKTGQPAIAQVGDNVDYTIEVFHAPTSDGSPVTIADVTDSLGILLAGPSGDDGDGVLESAETWTYIGSREILPDDPHSLVNEACVIGTDIDGDSISDCDTATTTVEHAPALLVEKTSAPQLVAVGDQITYTITVQHDVTSDGSPVSLVSVSDSLGIPVSGPSGDDGDAVLEPNEVWFYSATRTALETDPHDLVNTVCAEGQDLDGDAVSDCGSTTTEIAHPGVQLLKQADRQFADIGETIQYTFSVWNTGDVDLANVALSDNVLGTIQGPSTGDDGDGVLESGEVWVYEATHTVAEQDLPGPIVNTATVLASPPVGAQISDTDTEDVQITFQPAIEVLKEASSGPFAVGDTITYTYTVANTGNVTLTGISLNDDLLGTITLGQTELSPSEVTSGTATHIVTLNDLDTGSITNIAEVTATPPVGAELSDSDTEVVSFTQLPGVEVLKVASDGPFAVSDTITYIYTITNTGNVTLTDVSASDDLLGVISLGTSTLAPQASTTGTLTHVVTQDDFDNGSIVNVATAAGTPPDGVPVEDTDEETVSFGQTPGIEVIKTASDGPFAVGDTITYIYTVTNTGNVTLTDVSASDDLLGVISLGTSTLAPQASTTGTLTHVVTQADFDSGSVLNVATTTGTPPSGAPVEDTDEEIVSFGQTPGIEVVKTASDGPFVVGDTITYTYVITNTGNVTLSNISASDDLLGAISLGTSTLAPQASTTGTLTHVVTQSDFDNGSIVNVATTSGTPPSGLPVEDTDEEIVSFGQTPGIEVVKTASDGPFAVGDTITYTYVVTNTGNVTLTNVSASDDLLGAVSLGTSTLVPQASTTGTLTHVVTQDEFNAGSIVNVATGVGTPPSGVPVEDTDQETVSFGQTPGIEVVKTASDGPFAVGDTITYTYVVTNTGNVTLTNVSASDDLLGSITLGTSTLAPQASTTGALTHVVTQDDFNAGSIVNVATTAGMPPSGVPVEDSDDETVTFTLVPSIKIVKTASDGPFAVGDTITYTYVITNTGNVTLTNISASDDLLGAISLGTSTLAPQASTTGTLTHVVTQDDFDNDSIVNVATAAGTPPSGIPVEATDEETVSFGQIPGIEVVKTASDGPFAVGDTITYTYVVTNTGNVTLTNVSASDDLLGVISLGTSTLVPQASTTGTLTHVVTQHGFDDGSIVNVATATGTPPSGIPVEDTDEETVSFGQTPGIEVVKTASDGPFAVGDTITYTYVITNTGNVTLTNISASDDLLGVISLGTSTLAPQASTTGTLTHIVTQDDFNNGSIVNVATTTGTPPSGIPVEDTDEETVSFGQTPGIEVVKTASDGPFAVGDTITYTYVVTNTGNVTLTNVSASDDLLGAISVGASTLAPQASTTGTLTHVVTQDDFDDGSIVNVATATGTPPSGIPVEDTDQETVSFGQTPGIEVIKTASDGPFAVGDTITYTYVVTNTGNVTLTNISASDDLLGVISLGTSTLAPHASTTGTLTYVVTQDDFNAGSIVNVATAVGTPPSGVPVEDTDDETVTFALVPSIKIAKTPSSGPFAVGDTVTYTYVITNTGNVTLTNVSASDDLLGAISLSSATLAPQASTTGTLTHVVTQDDFNAGSIVNVATAVGTPPTGPDVNDDDTATVDFNQIPSIEVVKTASDGPFAVGDTITYTYVVTNTGNVTLTNVSASDDLLGAISLGTSTLAPQASTTGTLTHVVTQDDFDNGSIVNVATAVGTPPSGIPVEDTDQETVSFGQTPGIEVIKTASDGPFAVGDTITYTYVITNTGNVTLTDVSASDDLLGAISLSSSTLAPSASTTGTLTHVVTQDNIDDGSIVNVATATGTPPSGITVEDTDEETVSFGQTPGIEVVKTASDGPFAVGDTITYTYVVTNTGNVTLTNVSASDDLLGAINLGTSTLAPQASTTGTLTHVVTQDDFDNGSIVNVATAVGTPPSGIPVDDTDDATVSFGLNPSIEILKSSSGGPFAVGDTVTYTYVITNTGNVTLTNVSASDDLLGAISLGTSTLAPQASTTGTLTHVVTQDDLNAGSIVNVATATGTPPSGVPVEDTDEETVSFGQTPGIEVVKTASDGPFAVGDTITYTYVVTNTGNVTLTNITASDDLLGAISLGSATLAPQASTTDTLTHVVTQDDFNAGSIVNVATATGTPPSGIPVEDTDEETVSFGQTPGIEVVKTASDGPFAVGDTITYTYVITNTGNVTLTNISASDDLLGVISLGTSTLAPQASTTGTLTHVVTQDDFDSGSIVNVATTTGTPPSGIPVEDTDEETVSFGLNPAIEVLKNASDGPFAVGDTITYTYVVTNTGNVTLTNISASDDLLGVISLGTSTLAPQASTTGTLTHVVTQDDFDDGSIVNVATATGTPPSGIPVEDTDEETVSFGQTPGIEVVKTASDGPFAVGDTITYTYVVTNTGNVTLTNVSAIDDLLGAISLGTSTLAPQASTTGTLTHVVTQDDFDNGSIVNVATAVGTPPSGVPVEDTDQETVSFGQTPGIEVVKTASDGPFAVGDTITYTYVATNTGNVTLINVSASDDLLGPISLSSATLAPSASTTGTLTHVVTQDDINDGSIVNIATAVGTPPSGVPIEDTDDETVSFGQTPGIEVVKTASDGPFAVGDTITYTYVVTNTGNVTLTSVFASDDLLGAISLGTSTLAPQASTTGTLTHVVTQDDFDSGSIVNVATATGTPPSGVPVEDTDDETVSFGQTPGIEVVKTASEGPFAVGDTITYTYVVTNTGNVTLTSVSASDDLLGAIDLSTSTLAPQASTTGTLTHVVTQDDFDDGSILNVATATGTPPSGLLIEDTDDETVSFALNPAIEIAKTASDGPFAVGDTITYTYVVSNTGNVTLTNISASDDLLGLISLGTSTLAPQASTTGTLTHVVTQDDFDDGSIVNVATATGTPPSGVPIEDTDEETVSFGQTPGIEVIKTASDGPFAVGDTITYTYVVTNTGNVTLTSVSASDDLLGAISLGTPTLAPQASTTGTLTHVVTQDDFDDGSIVNVATATGTPPSGVPIEDTDDETVSFGQTPGIEVVKTASEGPFAVGDTITYTYVVTNTGNVTLTSVSASDDLLGVISLGTSTLVPQASTTGTLTHVVTQDDFDDGSIVNVATATGTPPSGVPVEDIDDETVSFGQTPGIEVVKTASDGPFAVGDTITYTYVVTNTGNVTLTSVSASDDLLGAINLGTSALAPQASTTGTLTHVVAQDDFDTGSIVNVATATGTPPSGVPVEDTDDETVSFGQTPGIEVVKTASDGPFAVGDTITYTYVATNTGNVTLTNVSASDDLLGAISLGTSTLAPQASTTGTLTHVVTQDDIDNGSIVNVATAVGTPPSGVPVEDTDEETISFGQTPGMEVVKTASDGPFAVGDTITYTYVVTNTGNVTLTSVSASDDLLGAISLGTSTLAPQASTTGTLTHVVTQDDIDNGSIVNVATAVGTPPSGVPVEDTDDETVVFNTNPGIQVEKTASSGPFVVGDTIDYSYVITNVGNVTLTSVTLIDDILGSIALSAIELAPGTSATGSAAHVVTQDNLDLGEVINIATAAGTAPDQSTVQDEDTETVTFDQNPLLVIEKTGDVGPVQIGDTINYTITVVNAGNVTLTNVQVDDPVLSFSHDLGVMAPGDSQTLNVSYGPVLASDFPEVLNTAFAESDQTGTVQDSHAVEVFEPRVDLELTKIVSDPFPEVGSVVNFILTLSNAEGYANGTGIEITDYLPVGYSYAGPFTASQGSFVPAGDGRSGLWIVGDVPSGSAATLIIPVIVEAAEDPLDYVSAAEVSAANEEDVDSVPANADVQPEDDDDFASIDSDTALADLFVLKDVDAPTIAEGGTAVFTIVVYNGGPYPTSGVVLSDVLPTGLQYASHDTSVGNYDAVLGSWNVGSLFVGESATLELTVLASPGTADSTITNLATIVASDVPDPSDANNTDTASVTILPIPEAPEGGGGATDECEGKVIISEIAWAGTAANPDHEWIELRNVGGEPVDVTGWILRWRKKDPVIEQDFEWKTIELYGELDASPVPACDVSAADVEPTVEFIKRETDAISWTVAARPINYDDSYMVLERQTDETISNVPADIIYDDVEPYVMEFTNEGDIIELLDAEGNVVDTANAFASYDGSWPAGDARTYGTMERIDPLGEDEPGNWHTNLGIVTYGLDAEGRPLVATSDVINSQTLEDLELFAELNSTKTLPGARLEVGLDLPRSARLQSGWPWIRITRPGFDATAGGGGDDVSSAAPSYSFASRYANDLYWLGIDTAGLVPGDYLVWIVYGDGKTVLVPITVI